MEIEKLSLEHFPSLSCARRNCSSFTLKVVQKIGMFESAPLVPVLPEKASAGTDLYSSLAEWYWVVRAGEVRDWGLQGRVARGDF